MMWPIKDMFMSLLEQVVEVMKSLAFGLEKEFLHVFLYLLAFTSKW